MRRRACRWDGYGPGARAGARPGFGCGRGAAELHAANRARYGITDGPAYRDLEDPGAALFHITVQDMDTAMGWFRSDTFKEATRLAKVTGRSFYLAQPQA